MTSKEFLNKTIRLYHKARNSAFPHIKIFRGRSHSISSDSEDLFALFLSDKIDCNAIYVDQPISVKGFSYQIYPDITLVCKGQITAFCDLKMDLGWKRDKLADFCTEQFQLMKKVRGKECKIRNGITKQDSQLKISKNASMNIVIITDQNIQPLRLKAHLEKAGKLKPAVEVFILTSGEHPNTYGLNRRVLKRKIKINEDQFESLLSKLNSTK